MAQVEVRGVGPFQQIFGQRWISVEVPPNSPLNVLFNELDRRFGGRVGSLLRSIEGTWNDRARLFLFLNGRDIRFLQRRDPPLRDGDTVLFLPVLAGG